MVITLQKWGNSSGIRIPSNILKSLNIHPNDILNITQVDDKIVITKSNKKKYSLKEKIEKYNGEDLTKEFEWDEPRGKEIW